MELTPGAYVGLAPRLALRGRLPKEPV